MFESNAYNVSVKFKAELEQFIAALSKGEDAVKGIGDSAKKTDTAFGKLKDTAMGLVKGFTALYIIREVGRYFKDAITIAAEYSRGLSALTAQTKGLDLSAKDLIKTLQEQTNYQVAQVDLVNATNRAIALLGRDAIPRLGELADIATRAAKVMGLDVTQAFDDIVTGIGRESRMILDNLGIIISSEKAYKDYANQLNKSVDALTDAEKRQAFLNAAIEQGKRKYSGIAKETGGYKDKTESLSAAWKDLTTNFGLFVTEATPAANILGDMADKIRSINLLVSGGKADLYDYLNGLMAISYGPFALYAPDWRNLKAKPYGGEGKIKPGEAGFNFPQLGMGGYVSPPKATMGPEVPKDWQTEWQIDPVTGQVVRAPRGWATQFGKTGAGGAGAPRESDEEKYRKKIADAYARHLEDMAAWDLEFGKKLYVQMKNAVDKAARELLARGTITPTNYIGKMLGLETFTGVGPWGPTEPEPSPLSVAAQWQSSRAQMKALREEMGGAEEDVEKPFQDIGEALNNAIAGLADSIATGDIAGAIQNTFTLLGQTIGAGVSKMITADIGGGGMFGGIMGALGGGLVGVGISLLGGLFGGGKGQGATPYTPIYASITNWGDFFKLGTTLPSSFVYSGRAGGYPVDPHGRTLTGWSTGQHYDN